MKSIGIVRNIDELGRITLPMELRRTLEISTGDAIDISVDGEKVVLEKYKPANRCCICGSDKEIIKIGDKGICKQCIQLAKRM